MDEIIKKIPEQIKEGLKTGEEFKLDKKYDSLIICGMGGSIIPGEILLTCQSLKNKSSRPSIFIQRDYDLPEWASEKDLVICISWSGETEETISSYKTAIKRGLPTVVVAGGTLSKRAAIDNIKLILMPSEKIPPRFAIGYMTGALFGLLGLKDEFDFELKAEEMEKEGKDLAAKIGDKIPVIYSSFKWRKLANFWKILFNENAKIPAFWNSFPSLTHNEIAGFTPPLKNIFPILIKGDGDDERQNRNIEAAIAIFNKLGYNYNIVNLSASGKALERIFKNYILGLWTSCFLAKNLGVDPEKNALIEEFKHLKRSSFSIKLVE